MGRKTRQDWELWEQVKKTVTPSKPQNRSDDFETLFENPHKELAKPKARQSRIIKPHVSEPDFRLNLISSPAGLEKSIGRKISKGKIRIDGRLDLHGLTQEEAYSRMYRFIEDAFSDAKRTVLVITGKGKLGEGILRKAVPRWLSEPGFKDKVIGCREAHISHGGGGALYVRLRNRNRMNEQ